MSCNVPYIRSKYAGNPELISKLEQINTDIWNEINNSKLFREYGKTRLFSKPNTKLFEKQRELISSINRKYNAPYSLIHAKLTKSGVNHKVVVTVNPIAESVWRSTDAARKVEEDRTKLGIDQFGDSVPEELANKSNDNIKPGVSDIFNENPELSKVGSPQQYSRYLDTVFPDSKVKEIVYHGSPGGKIDKFTTDKLNTGNTGFRNKGIFFSDNIHTAELYAGLIDLYGDNPPINPTGDVTSAIINTENPIVRDFKGAKFYGQDLDLNEVDENVNDSYISKNITDPFAEQNNYIVFKPSQIHILGSKEDIGGFRKYVEYNPLSNNNSFRELTPEQEANPFAVFVLNSSPDGVAITTRAADRGEGDRIGLPGGKVDEGEDPRDAAVREAREEGWEIEPNSELKIIASRIVDGKPIVWYSVDNAKPLEDYKEKHRGITPKRTSIEEISNSGYGNDFISKFLRPLSNTSHEKYFTDSYDLNIEKKYFSDGNETTSNEVLQKIAQSNHPLAPLAKELLKYDNTETPIKLVDTYALGKDKDSAAVYFPSSGTIEVAKYTKFPGKGSEPTLIHEIIHSLTYHILHRNSKEAEDFKRLFEAAKAHEAYFTNTYPLTNVDEFMTGIFTNGGFIEELKGIPSVEGANYKNLWEQIMDYFRKLFGITDENKTLFEQAFALGTNIIKHNHDDIKAYNDFKEQESRSQESLGSEPLAQRIGQKMGTKSSENNLTPEEQVDNITKEILARHSQTEKRDVEETVDGKKETIEKYFFNGKKVPQRVHDKLRDKYKNLSRNRDITKSEEQEAIDDLKRKKGTLIHKDFEHALTLMVDPVAHTVLTEGQFRANKDRDKTPNNINNDKVYNKIVENLWKRVNSFPKGTKFLSEVQVVNDKIKTPIGGTIDLVALSPDKKMGFKVSLLDWKTISINTERYTEVPWYNIDTWRMQMGIYKKMMEQVYGIKAEQFNQTRMVPIHIEYQGNARKANEPIPKEPLKIKDVEIGDVDPKNIESGKEYLLPVGLESESTGNKQLDDLIIQLNAIYNRKSGTAVSKEKKRAKATELNLLFKAIRHLQLKQDPGVLITYGESLNKNIQLIKDEYDEKYSNLSKEDLGKLDDKDISDFADKLDDALKDSEIFATLKFYLGLYDQDVSKLSGPEKEVRENILEVVDGSDYNIKILKPTIEQFADKIVATRKGVHQLLNSERIVKGFSKLFRSTALLPVSTIKVLYRIVDNIKHKSDFEMRDEAEKVKNLSTAYHKLAKQMGWAKKNYFDILKKKDSNQLIDQYSKEFYRNLEKAVRDGNTKWISENVDMKAYDDYLQKKLKDKLESIENNTYETGKEEEKERAINDANLKNKNSNAWKQYTALRQFPIEKWESEEYKTLKSTPEAFAVYQYIRRRNDELAAIGYIDNSEARKFLPYIRSSTVERAMMGQKLDIGRQFMQSIAVDDATVGYGAYDPLTGEMVNRIPAYFTSRIPANEQSQDLFHNLDLLNYSAIRYKYLKESEGQVNLLYRVEQGKKAIATNAFGHVKKDERGKYSEVENSSNAALFRDQMRALMYDQRFSTEGSFDMFLGNLGGLVSKVNDFTEKKLHFKLLPDVKGNVTLTRSVDAVNKFLYLKMLNLFNIGSPISNTFGGVAQVSINAGTFFSGKDYGNAMLHLFVNKLSSKDGNKIYAAMKYFMPYLENTSDEMASEVSINKITSNKVNNFIFSLMRHSDRAVTAGVLLAMLDNTILIDNKVVNINDYIKSRDWFRDRYKNNNVREMEKRAKDLKKSLLESNGVLKLSTLDNEGHLVIPGIKNSSEDIFELRRLVQGIATDALGNMTESEIRAVNMSLIGKSMMVFHNWIPRLVDVRFGQINYNDRIDAYEWGRARSFMRILGEQWFKQGASLRNVLEANEKGIAYLESLYLRKKEEYEKMNNKDFEMSPEQFYDMVRQNIRSQIKDFLAMSIMLALWFGVKAIPRDPDEDPRVRSMHDFAVRMMDKLSDELAFYYDPLSFDQLVNGKMFPAAETLTSSLKFMKSFLGEMYGLTVQDDSIIEKEHPVKYLMKTFPFARQLTQFLPIYAPDAAKQWGVRMTTSNNIQ